MPRLEIDKAIEQAARDAADENGMCTVVALIDNVRDNGHRYNKGDEFHMHADLVAGHAATGQVELMESTAAPKKAVKGSPNKQFTGGTKK